MTLAEVRRLYADLNGDHRMTAADDTYVRMHFAPVAESTERPQDNVLALMAERRLPLPSYLLSDGTPMVHPDFLAPVEAAGSVEALKIWFMDQWPSDEQEVAESEWAEYLSGQYVCLWSVTPTTIQAKTSTIELIKAEVAELDAGRGSRERLRKAVDALDALEPPFTAYDLLRFGGPTSRQVWIDDIRSAYGTGVRTPS